jgi:hypothetical protein
MPLTKNELEQIAMVIRQQIAEWTDKRHERDAVRDKEFNRMESMLREQQGQIRELLDIVKNKKHDRTLYGDGSTDEPGMIQHIGSLLKESSNFQWIQRAVLGAIIPLLVLIFVYLVVVHGLPVLE